MAPVDSKSERFTNQDPRTKIKNKHENDTHALQNNFLAPAFAFYICLEPIRRQSMLNETIFR